MQIPRFRSTGLTILAYGLATVVIVVVVLAAWAFYKVRVPDTALTAEQRALPYAKYFDRPIAVPSAELLAAVAQPMDCNDALPINEINTLLEPGYQKVETGYCIFADGGGYSSVLIDMPGVTLDMFNWWFIWHPQESLRYRIWDKDDHFEVSVDAAARQQFNDETLPLADRLWGSTHHVRENIGIPLQFRLLQALGGQDPYAITIHFVPPEQCGFDMTRFDFSKETLVCADSGMRHFVRETAEGVELRSRFYSGYVLKDGVFVREGSEAPIDIQAGLNRHMIKEFTNLASFLPELYAEQGPRTKAEALP